MSTNNERERILHEWLGGCVCAIMLAAAIGTVIALAVPNTPIEHTTLNQHIRRSGDQHEDKDRVTIL
jgi:hypothetical protein